MKFIKYLFQIFLVMGSLSISSCKTIPYSESVVIEQATQYPTNAIALEIDKANHSASLSPENIWDIEKLTSIGEGKIYSVATSPDKNLLAVRSATKITIYELLTFEEISSIALTPNINDDKKPISFSPDGKYLLIKNKNYIQFWDTELQEFNDEFGIYSQIPAWTVDSFEMNSYTDHVIVKTVGYYTPCDSWGMNFAIYDVYGTLVFDDYFCESYNDNYFKFTEDSNVYLFYTSIMTSIRPLKVHGIDLITENKFLTLRYEGPSHFDATDEELNQYTEGFFFDISEDGQSIATSYFHEDGVDTVIKDAQTHQIIEAPDWDIRKYQLVKNSEPECDNADDIDTFDPSDYYNYNFVYRQDDIGIVTFSRFREIIAVELWDLANCKQLNRISSVWGTEAEISPDGKLLAFSNDFDIFLWDLEKDQLIHTIAGIPFEKPHDIFLFNQAGDKLITSSYGRDNNHPSQLNKNTSISIWDIETGSLSREIIPTHDTFLRELVLTPDPDIILARSKEWLTLWDINSGELIQSFSTVGDPFAYTVDEQSVWITSAHAGNKFLVSQYDFYSGELRQSIETRGPWVRDVYLNSDSSKLCVHTFLGQGTGLRDMLRIYDIASGQLLSSTLWSSSFDNPSSKNPYFTNIPTGDFLAEHGFSLISPSWSYRLESPYLPLQSGNLSSNQNLLINFGNSDDNEISIFDPNNGLLINTLDTESDIRYVDFSPNGEVIFFTGTNGIIHVWGLNKP